MNITYRQRVIAGKTWTRRALKGTVDRNEKKKKQHSGVVDSVESAD